MLDNRYTVETPEGVQLPLSPAGLYIRGMAFLIDFLLRCAFYVGISTVLAFIGNNSLAGLILISLFLIEWFYPVFFEVFMDGATPGKKIYHLKVVNDDGTPVSFFSSLSRNLLRTADFLPALFTGGIITMLCNKRHKRLGDLVAGTVVVHTEQAPKKIQLTEPGVLPLPYDMTPEQQQAIINFAERKSRLSQARADELANILKPSLGIESISASQQLQQIANGLLGRS